MGDAKYKAQITRAILDEVDKLPAKERDAVLERFGPDHLHSARQASRADWLPAEVQAALDVALYETLGAEGQEALMCRYTLTAVDTPLFAPLARGALNLLGGGPHGVFKTVQRTWPFVSKHCGGLLVQRIENGAVLTYTGVPPALRHPAFASSNRGSFKGMLEFVRKTGEIETDLSRLESEGTVTHRITWS